MDLINYGALGAQLPPAVAMAFAAILLLGSIFNGSSLRIVAGLALVLGWTLGVSWWVWLIAGPPLVVLLVPPLRRALLSDRILRRYVSFEKPARRIASERRELV